MDSELHLEKVRRKDGKIVKNTGKRIFAAIVVLMVAALPFAVAGVHFSQR